MSIKKSNKKALSNLELMAVAGGFFDNAAFGRWILHEVERIGSEQFKESYGINQTQLNAAISTAIQYNGGFITQQP